MEKNNISTQDWITVEEIYGNGVVKVRGDKYLKIIKVFPINFSLKSNLEKEAILNSYKIFLKTCNFDIQILIQSCKENLEKNILNIEKNLEKENKQYLKNLAEDYFNFIQKLNSTKNSSNKIFYIIISNKKQENLDNVFQELNEKYFKIKECLFRCGNSVQDFNSKEQVQELFNNFFKYRFYLS